MKKWLTGILFLFMCLFLTGCGSVEPEKRAFPLIISIDYDSGYEVIFGIPDLSRSTGQIKRENVQNELNLRNVYKGNTFPEIEEKFGKSQENYLDLGHIKVILMGKGLLENKEALTKMLAYLEGNPDIAGNIYVFSSEQIREVMALNGNEIDSLGDYLTGILENKPKKDTKNQVLLQDLYNAWHNEDEFPDLPLVKLEGNQIMIE